MIKVVHESNKNCVMCRYWNRGMGCPSLEQTGPRFYKVDNKETQTCSKTGFTKKAFDYCSNFEKR